MKEHVTCVVCGARQRDRFQFTCDSLCTRAYHTGRSRGAQSEAELRREWRRPITVDRLVSREFAEELEYNRPYIVDVLTDRRNR
jgi:hypothetical protein